MSDTDMPPFDINGQAFEFLPPMVCEASSMVEVKIRMPDGRATVIMRCVTSGQVIELRSDCQVVEDGDKRIIVAAPGSIVRPKLSWKIRLLRWLAKG